MTLHTFILIIVFHFIFDWILQPRWMAEAKKELTLISAIHSVESTFWLLLLFHPYVFFVNVILHTLQDRFIYRILSTDTERKMVNVVALDQMLHFFILYLTLIFFN